MHKALYSRKLKNKVVNCKLCPHNCIISPGSCGFCNARKNVNGVLMSMAYGNLAAIAVDPIEKKPLFHFLPGTHALSIGTAGCNLGCLNCQNWEISRAKPSEKFNEIKPAQIVKQAMKTNCRTIAYTYNEPTMQYEFMADTSKLAKKKAIKSVIVSNGYINQTPLKKLCKLIDGANIDLKSIKDEFYRKNCSGALQPVLETLKTLKNEKIWLEITNLLIPTMNDAETEIRQLCEWVKENLGTDTPLHFTAFYPCHKMLHIPPTPKETIMAAKKIAEETGLEYVYTGNLREESSTICPNCKKKLVERISFMKTVTRTDGSCECGKTIPGVWK